MSYTAIIHDTQTNEKREYDFPDFNWEEDSDYLWSDGNFSCDCNRSLFFSRALDLSEEEINPCGHTRYVVTIKVGDQIVYEEIEGVDLEYDFIGGQT